MNSTHAGHLLRSILIGAAAIAALAHSGLSAAQQRGRGNFDHLLTTFPLTGVHAITPCEDCHIGGQMAGTPKQCEYCHRQGSRIAATVKPARHVQTNEPCDNCHRSAATWSGARYSHVTVTPGTCFSCHNGSMVSGKPANHVVTTMSCDNCHRTVAWIPAGFNHAGVAPGTCGTCHVQGGSGLAAPANHIPYQSQLLAGSSMGCDACHKSTTTFTVETMNHNNSMGNGAGWCIGCHLSGTNYLGNMRKNSLTHQQKTGVTDCSQSGCHRPLGNQGSTYRSW
jgi:hypothetical protein